MSWSKMRDSVLNFFTGEDFSREQLESQMNFKREVAQNAHQWEVEDLKKAGLNPQLSVAGSSAGAIAGSQVSLPTRQPTAGLMGSVAQILQSLNAVRLTSSQVEVNKATAARELSQAGLNELEASKLGEVGPLTRYLLENPNIGKVVSSAGAVGAYALGKYFGNSGNVSATRMTVPESVGGNKVGSTEYSSPFKPKIGGRKIQLARHPSYSEIVKNTSTARGMQWRGVGLAGGLLASGVLAHQAMKTPEAQKWAEKFAEKELQKSIKRGGYPSHSRYRGVY